MRLIEQAVLPIGFLANGIVCGLKKSGKLDLALLYSQVPAKVSCLFTTNKVVAAPLKVCKEHLLRNSKFQAIIANSGNANCFTGKQGIKDAQEMVSWAAKALGIKKDAVLVNSTGIIGKNLDINKIRKSMPLLVKGLGKQGIDQAKKAIMTTDKFVKEITVQCDIGGKDVTVCGIAKGAGMISPKMATMFAFILTDADIEQAALDKAVREATEKSFNSITVDGCMSTNDSVMAMANGQAKNSPITAKKNYQIFYQALYTVFLTLAKMMVRDGEGASKFIEIHVQQARNLKEAKTAALAIANSNLFKTAMYGQNPNYGRVIAAVGACGVAMQEDKIKVHLGSLEKTYIHIDVCLGMGKAECVVYTSDLTPEYIKINAAYN